MSDAFQRLLELVVWVGPNNNLSRIYTYDHGFTLLDLVRKDLIGCYSLDAMCILSEIDLLYGRGCKCATAGIQIWPMQWPASLSFLYSFKSRNSQYLWVEGRPLWPPTVYQKQSRSQRENCSERGASLFSSAFGSWPSCQRHRRSTCLFPFSFELVMLLLYGQTNLLNHVACSWYSLSKRQLLHIVIDTTTLNIHGNSANRFATKTAASGASEGVSWSIMSYHCNSQHPKTSLTSGLPYQTQSRGQEENSSESHASLFGSPLLGLECGLDPWLLWSFGAQQIQRKPNTSCRSNTWSAQTSMGFMSLKHLKTVSSLHAQVV